MSDINEIMKKASAIKLVVFDVDGVLTNGEIVYAGTNLEIKVFHAHDGLGMKLLKQGGCEVAILSSRSSSVVTIRMQELGIEHVFQGQTDKRTCLLALQKKLQIEQTNTAYVGDDLVDLPAMRLSGLAVAVANAHQTVCQHADWVTTRPGGNGAVREVCDLILTAQGKLDALQNAYLQ